MTMTYTRTVALGDDVIDPRDIVARVEELESETVVDIDHPVQPLDEDDEASKRMTCGTCGRSWDDGKVTSMTPAPSGRCPFEYYHLDEDDAEELAQWREILDEINDLEDGEALILDSYFEEYARQLAEDIGAIPDDASWPITCIDWEQAAEQLQTDYTSFEWDGYTYWQHV